MLFTPEVVCVTVAFRVDLFWETNKQTLNGKGVRLIKCAFGRRAAQAL